MVPAATASCFPDVRLVEVRFAIPDESQHLGVPGLRYVPLNGGKNGDENNFNSNTNAKKAAVVQVSQKDRIGLGLNCSPCAFIPFVSHDERRMHSFCSFTPPESPYMLKSSFPSPSPSMMSMTNSEITESSAAFSDYSRNTKSCSPISAFQKASMLNLDEGSRSPVHTTSAWRTSAKKKKTRCSSGEIDNISRKKTELCFHFMDGIDCPYGDDCTYAHGEEELEMKTFGGLRRDGVDVRTYRAKPCMTWVSTGSCPFGSLRCRDIHDPRIKGATPSWILTHTETQGNGMDTDINVDGLHQKRLHTILYGTPFGDQFSLELDDWTDLYKLVCNTNTVRRRRNMLSEMHKLSIAIQMRGGPGWMYKYRPQHYIYNAMCMVLQKRAFQLEKSGDAISIPLSSYKRKCHNHVIVREIAFSTDSDTSVRGVALWFNIPESSVVQIPPQQAKRYRHKPGTGYRYKKSSKQEDKAVENDNQSSPFDWRECFTMIRPHDHDAFELTTNILKNRFEALKAEKLTALKDHSSSLNKCQKEKESLGQLFQNQKRHWISWTWPINEGREAIINDDDAPVPPVVTEYSTCIGKDSLVDGEENKKPIIGSNVQPIWNSFTTLLSEDVVEPKTSPNQKRLTIFERLSRGEKLCSNRTLPHIRFSPKETVLCDNNPLIRQSERGWKSLLLKQEQTHEANEWEIVRQNFEARSKNVRKQQHTASGCTP